MPQCCARAGVYKLASLVQYVPLPVVAGYLGYVGYFCLAAGISLACNVEVRSLFQPLEEIPGLSKLAGSAVRKLSFPASWIPCNQMTSVNLTLCDLRYDKLHEY